MQRSENENSTRRTGTRYEDAAAAYLEGKNYRILQRNFRCRTGEVDLIARDGAFLVFVEVKYRRTAAHGSPLEAVGAKKQRRIAGAAMFYLSKCGISPDTPIRFDVLGLTGDGVVVHVENAFPLGI